MVPGGRHCTGSRGASCGYASLDDRSKDRDKISGEASEDFVDSRQPALSSQYVEPCIPVAVGASAPSSSVVRSLLAICCPGDRTQNVAENIDIGDTAGGVKVAHNLRSDSCARGWTMALAHESARIVEAGEIGEHLEAGRSPGAYEVSESTENAIAVPAEKVSQLSLRRGRRNVVCRCLHASKLVALGQRAMQALRVSASCLFVSADVFVADWLLRARAEKVLESSG